MYAELVGDVAVVDVDDRRPGLVDAELGLDPLGPVPGEDRHVVAGRDPGVERGGGRGGSPARRARGRCSRRSPGDERGAVGDGVDDDLEEVGEVERAWRERSRTCSRQARQRRDPSTMAVHDRRHRRAARRPRRDRLGRRSGHGPRDRARARPGRRRRRARRAPRATSLRAGRRRGRGARAAGGVRADRHHRSPSSARGSPTPTVARARAPRRAREQRVRRGGLARPVRRVRPAALARARRRERVRHAAR